ncbi:hypothetical protein lerEdw1_006386 [Lerista edwardsae]|nr:hypothetical protein lerEdw1_006386 [Lerista edwardsae]
MHRVPFADTRERDVRAAPSKVPEATPPPHTEAAPATSSEADPQGGRAYFSGKARVSFRHQLDAEREATS